MSYYRIRWEENKWAPWAYAFLKKHNIPERFRLEDLTIDQKSALVLFYILKTLWEAGLIEIRYDEKEIYTRLTEKGKELLRKMRGGGEDG
jgi:predicted methyltransferase